MNAKELIESVAEGKSARLVVSEIKHTDTIHDVIDELTDISELVNQMYTNSEFDDNPEGDKVNSMFKKFNDDLKSVLKLGTTLSNKVKV